MYLKQDDGIDIYSVSFEGSMQEELEKRNFEQKTTLTGKKKRRWSDAYENLSISITRMSEKNYIKLRTIFKRPYICELYTDEGDIKLVSFSSDKLSLTRFQDKDSMEFFRRGSISLEE